MLAVLGWAPDARHKSELDLSPPASFVVPL
jgi:hypothetical protein